MSYLVNKPGDRVSRVEAHMRMSVSTMTSEDIPILKSCWVAVKAVKLTFITGRGSAISSTQEGKSGFVYWVDS